MLNLNDLMHYPGLPNNSIVWIAAEAAPFVEVQVPELIKQPEPVQALVWFLTKIKTISVIVRE